jgi:hypothetical protein
VVEQQARERRLWNLFTMVHPENHRDTTVAKRGVWPPNPSESIAACSSTFMPRSSSQRAIPPNAHEHPRLADLRSAYHIHIFGKINDVPPHQLTTVLPKSRNFRAGAQLDLVDVLLTSGKLKSTRWTARPAKQPEASSQHSG